MQHFEQNAELAALSAAHERERAHVGRVLHDTVGQLLTAAGLQLDVLRLDLRERVLEISERTAEIQAILEQAIEAVRELSYVTNPAIIARIGLAAALTRLLQGPQAAAPMAAKLEVPTAAHVPEPAASKFYSLVWITLAVARHLGARNIFVKIWDSEGAYVLEVLYDVSSPERLQSLDGLDIPVVIDSIPGQTRVRAQYAHGLRGAAG